MCRRCCTWIYISKKKMAQRCFLRCSIFSCSFQADMAYRPHNREEDSFARRVHIPIRQPSFHILFPGTSHIKVGIFTRFSHTDRPTSTSPSTLSQDHCQIQSSIHLATALGCTYSWSSALPACFLYAASSSFLWVIGLRGTLHSLPSSVRHINHLPGPRKCSWAA